MTDSVLRSSAGMAVGTVLSRVTGLLRDIAMTAALGFYLVSDAFSLGNTLPNIIYILVVGGALNAVFIPQLVRHMADDADAGKAFADRLLTATGTLLLLLSLFAIAAAPLIVRLYTPAEMTTEQFELAVAFARLCLPQIFFYGAYTMLQQVLNARGKFAAAMFAPIANNLVAIVIFVGFLLVVKPDSEKLTSLSPLQTWWLGAGTTLGVLVQAAVLFVPLLRTGYKFQLRFDWRESGLGKAAKLAGWTIGLVLANQISYVVITRIATSANLVAAANGDVATGLTTYQKAHLIFVLPHSVIAVSLVTALLPMMSKLAHSKDFTELGRQISKYVGILISVMLPVSVLLGMTGPDLAAVMFGYGAAGIDAARATGMVVSALALGLPAYSLLYVLYRAWYAQENTRTPFFIAVILNLLNVGLAIGFSAGVDNFARVTALGIAYSVAYNLVVILAWIWLRRTGIGLETKRNFVTGLKVLAASSVMALWVVLLPDISDTVQAKMLLELMLEWGSGLAIFLLFAKLFRITEIQQVLSTLAGKFARN